MFIEKKQVGEKQLLKWTGVDINTYPQPELLGVTKQVLIPDATYSSGFEVRYYHFGVGSTGDKARHDKEYCLFILHGNATIVVNETAHVLTQYDVAYISPNELIQILPRGNEPLGFLCITK